MAKIVWPPNKKEYCTFDSFYYWAQSREPEWSRLPDFVRDRDRIQPIKTVVILQKIATHICSLSNDTLVRCDMVVRHILVD